MTKPQESSRPRLITREEQGVRSARGRKSKKFGTHYSFDEREAKREDSGELVEPCGVEEFERQMNQPFWNRKR